MSDWIILLVIKLVLVFIIFLGYIGLGAYTCSSKWRDSGMMSSWGPIKGCMIKRKNGTWIPSESFRETNE